MQAAKPLTRRLVRSGIRSHAGCPHPSAPPPPPTTSRRTPAYARQSFTPVSVTKLRVFSGLFFWSPSPAASRTPLQGGITMTTGPHRQAPCPRTVVVPIRSSSRVLRNNMPLTRTSLVTCRLPSQTRGFHARESVGQQPRRQTKDESLLKLGGDFSLTDPVGTENCAIVLA